MGWIARAPHHRRLKVHPFHKDFPATIVLDEKEIKKQDLKLHEIVRVELFPVRQALFKARVIEKFSSIDDPQLEQEIIQEKYAFPVDFSNEALKEANQNAKRQDHKRKDISDVFLVTIDGETAKDFDDAIFVKKINSHQYLLNVSIADVSFFVDAKSKLDREAFERGTSIYFPGRVVPMLPEVLSNHACSLVPHQKRYAITCEMIISSQGEIVKTEIFPSIIQSKARLTYTQVAGFFATKTEDFGAPIEKMLLEARELAEVLQKSRLKKGYLDLDLPELEIEVNEFGDVLKLQHGIRNEAHRLIESFMVIANEAVSEAIESKSYSSIFRVHEEPAPLKLERFHAIVKTWGIEMPKKLGPIEIQSFLEKIKGHRDEKLLALSLLRSLKQAHYTASNLGHFGLGSTSYCHFTSPIRRYPDLMIHRILHASKFLKLRKEAFSFDYLEKVALQCTEREQRAALAERSLRDMKKTRFMEAYLDQTFDAFIVSVKDFGFFVEIVDFACEGLVPLRSLPSDYWTIDPLEIELKGRKARRSFKLGDKIKVRLAEVDRYRAQMSFQYLSHLEEAG